MSAFMASSLYGAAPVVGAGPIAAPTERMASHPDIPGGLRGVVDPNNPLFWLFGIVAVMAGALGVAGSVRLGGATVSASVGKS